MANTNDIAGSLIGIRPIIYIGQDENPGECVGCGRPAHMWTIDGYNGYVDACCGHAKDFLLDAIESGAMSIQEDS